jgi:hypothetical protein
MHPVLFLSKLQLEILFDHQVDLMVQYFLSMSKPLFSPNFLECLVHWNFLFLNYGSQLPMWLEMSGLLPIRISEDYLFGVFENYRTQLICLEPESGLGSTLPDKILLLRISHPMRNLNARISLDCKEPYDFP